MSAGPKWIGAGIVTAAVGAGLMSALPAGAVYQGAFTSAPMGAVSLSYSRYGAHLCTGVLISPRWVVTARHCVESGYAGSAQAGSVMRGAGESVGLARQLEAPRGDIGLVQLTSDAPGPYMRWSANRITPGASTVTYGWGRTVSGTGGSASQRLKQVRATVTGFGGDPRYGGQGFMERFHDGGTRQGDSGGPVLTDGVLVGVHAGLSGGRGFAAPVAQVAQWIQQTTGVAPVDVAPAPASSTTEPAPVSAPPSTTTVPPVSPTTSRPVVPSRNTSAPAVTVGEGARPTASVPRPPSPRPTASSSSPVRPHPVPSRTEPSQAAVPPMTDEAWRPAGDGAAQGDTWGADGWGVEESWVSTAQDWFQQVWGWW